MTVGVDEELRIREYPGDDSANARPVPFKFLDNDDLKVTRVEADGSETVLVRGTHYSVAGAGNPSGGSVTPLAPIMAGTIWRIEGDMPLGQPTDYTAGDDFPAESHERGLDRSMIAHQEARRDINDTVDRSWLLPRGETGGTLPPAVARIGKFRAWGPDGREVPAAGIGGDDGLRQTIVSQFGAGYTGKREGGSVQDAIDLIASRASNNTLIAAGVGLLGGGKINATVTLGANFASEDVAEAGVSTTTLLSPATGKALIDLETAGLKLAIANGTIAALVTAVHTTQALLFADLVPADGQWGIVYDDADPLKEGFYRKSGATTTGNWQGPLLQDAFQANAAAILADAEAARDEAIAQNAGGDLGLVKIATSSSTTGWASRPELGDQPVFECDFTLTGGNPDGGQFARSAASAAAFAADGDRLQITSPGTQFVFAGLLLPLRVMPGLVFEVEYLIGAFDSGGGPAIGFTATAPVVGGPAILNLPADSGA
ncbi:hypothetical protein [Sphingopyxis granuli]|uniref:hypothetical protein n=1 Tax=Sphingopyxis granuli TaxID=267128 RepID=UPI001BAEBB84|nr:hypothetical protein [Sphingopyxis granuli]QUM73350.1 hypothetical protein ICN83_05540 [Sphingopyxis granuli]